MAVEHHHVAAVSMVSRTAKPQSKATCEHARHFSRSLANLIVFRFSITAEKRGLLRAVSEAAEADGADDEEYDEENTWERALAGGVDYEGEDEDGTEHCGSEERHCHERGSRDQ